MRNLKRALSLTLASVMLLGMMVVGSSAAKGYDDVAETDNVEAIEVLQAIEVMVGDDRGFGPERPVNRAEMAVVMGKLLNLDYNYYSATCPFDDVYDWARGWVGACAANKIVSGRGDGIYDPGATVTAVEAASMLMRALGYFQYSNDYADGFEVSTVRMGTTIGIFDNVGSSATEPMTRNQIAQMVLNALQSAVVEPDGNTINLTTPDGTVYTGKVNYVSVTSAKPFARAIGRVQATSVGSQNDGYIVELGERLYDGKLKLTDDYDPFGRPARNWEYDGSNIGVYAKKELMVFDHVGTVTGKDLYDLLGAKTIEDYKLTVNLDGVNDPEIVRAIASYDGDTTNIQEKHNVDYVFAKNDLNRNNKATIGATGTGVLTQVFVDHEADTIDIAIINTYLALADKDYDTKKEELSVTVYDLAKHTASGEYVKDIKDSYNAQLFKLAADDFSTVKDAAKNAAFLLTVAEGEVQSVVPAEVLSSVQISSFKRGDNVVVDGTTYKFDTTARFDSKALKVYTDLGGNGIINLKDLTYNVYLDAYGNLIGVEEVDAAKNYVFITAIDLNDSNLVNGTADARAIFLDGTVDTIRVNMGKSAITPYTNSEPYGGISKNSILNTWCTYTVNNSGVYTLTEVQDAADGTRVPDGTTNKSGLAQYHETVADGTPAGSNELTIDKKHITLKGKDAGTGDFARVYGDEKTVYLTAELDELTNKGGTWGVISDVDTVSVGIESTNLIVWENNTAMVEADDTDTRTVAPGDNGRDWSKGVYTLYDDGGIIIAAVVVGEDNGASKNLVYVHSSDVDWEAYNGDSASRASGDGLFTWTRKVVSNGEEVTLTEVSDGDSYLARMVRYNWYQIKTNSKGEVIAAYKLPGVADGSGLKDAKLTRYQDLALDYKNDAVPETGDKKIGEIAYTVQNGKDVVLYHNQKFINSYLHMSNRTLYVAHNDQTGFIVDKNVDYVLQQWNSNKKDTFVETGSGSDNLESVIKELNDRYGIFKTDGTWTGKTYTYQISAILENGVATSVVIYDNNNDYVRPGEDPTKPTTDTYTLTLKGSDLAGTTTVDGKTVFNSTVMYDIIESGKTVTKAVTGTQVVKPGETIVEFQVPAAATKVYVQNAAITTAGVTYYVGETKITSVTGTSENYLEFKMTDDLTLEAVPDAQSQTYTITFEKGITPEGFYSSTQGGKKVEATDLGNGVYRVKASDKVDYVKVTTTATEYAFAAGSETATMAPGQNVTPAPANTGTAQVIGFGQDINTNITIYGATKVTVVGLNPACFALAGSAGDATYVRPGTKLPVSIDMDDDGCTAAIAQVGTTAVNVANDRVHNGYEIGTTEVTLKAAFKVTLKNVKATFGGKDYTGEIYLASGIDCTDAGVTLAATKGTGIIDITDGVLTKAAYDATTDVAADVILSGAVTMTLTSVGASYKDGFGDDIDITSTELVEVGTKIDVVGQTTNDSGVVIKATVTNSSPEEVITAETSKACNGTDTGAKATFTVGVKNMTIAENDTTP